MVQGNSPVPFAFGKSGLMPQEEKLETGLKQKKLVIGIPRETTMFESRVALTPEAVEILVNNGHEIIIETNAGKAANYADVKYSECGGFIVSNKESVYRCDIVLKVAPLTLAEIEFLKGNQVVISSLHMNAQLESYIRNLLNKKVTALAFENMHDNHEAYPVLQAMSEIAGNTSILIAAEYLSNVHQGKGVFLGGITGVTPAEVTILGAGTAGEFAARAAMGLGAEVKIFDSSLYKLRSIQERLGRRVFTSVYHPQVLAKVLKSTDVLIGSVNMVEKGPRFLVSEEMVMQMKSGSVIVDISIDQGGCIETSRCTTHQDPVYVKHGVIHYCVPNIASRVARTASIALSNIFTPTLLRLAESGGIRNLIRDDAGIRKGVYIYNGILTNNYIGNAFGIPSKDIELLLAAF